jgi:hypothetical protein
MIESASVLWNTYGLVSAPVRWQYPIFSTGAAAEGTLPNTPADSAADSARALMRRAIGHPSRRPSPPLDPLPPDGVTPHPIGATDTRDSGAGRAIPTTHRSTGADRQLWRYGMPPTEAPVQVLR